MWLCSAVPINKNNEWTRHHLTEEYIPQQIGLVSNCLLVINKYVKKKNAYDHKFFTWSQMYSLQTDKGQTWQLNRKCDKSDALEFGLWQRWRRRRATSSGQIWHCRCTPAGQSRGRGLTGPPRCPPPAPTRSGPTDFGSTSVSRYRVPPLPYRWGVSYCSVRHRSNLPEISWPPACGGERARFSCRRLAACQRCWIQTPCRRAPRAESCRWICHEKDIGPTAKKSLRWRKSQSSWIRSFT